MSDPSMTVGLVERLRKRAADERAIQSNNEAVAEALKPQLEAFERRDGSHNTFAVRLHLDHRDCARHDAELAADWDAAADRIAVLEAALRPFVAVLEKDISQNDADGDLFHVMGSGRNKAPRLRVGHFRAAATLLTHPNNHATP